MGEYETIVVQRTGRVATVVLNRPEAMNALNAPLRRDLDAVLRELEQDGSVDVVILTGAGRAFCTGRDLKELGQSGSETLGKFPSVFDRVRLLEKPIIAAVRGFALTGGLELALCCDIVIAEEGTRFADTHARIGVVPGAGMSQLLPRLVGIKKAKEISLTGNFFTAEEALQWGMINKVVPPGELEAVSKRVANDIASNDQVLVRKMKKLIDDGEGRTIADAITMERYEHLRHMSTNTPEELERRRKEVQERGRTQAGQS